MTFLDLSGPTLIVALLGATLLVGFGADWLAVRFRVPDALWLIALGLLAGPTLGLISPSSLLLVAPILGTTALLLILFDAGIDLRISLIRPLAGSALLFAIASYAIGAVALFGISDLLLFPGRPTLSLILATSLGCVSGAVIIPLSHRLGLTRGLGSFLQLDGAVEDALAIIAVTTILLWVTPSSPDLALRLTLSLVLPLPVGILTGIAAGLGWLLFLYEWQTRRFAALATLGFVFLVYAATEALGGSGILAAIVFGGVLGNEPIVRRLLRRTRPFKISKDLRRIEQEMGFVLRAFFLFLIGMLVVPLLPSLTEGLILIAVPIVLYALRRAIFLGVSHPKKAPRGWVNPASSLLGRGLTSAVLLILAFQTLPRTSVLLFPALMVIIGTNVVMTVGLVMGMPSVPRETDAERSWALARADLLSLEEEGDSTNGGDTPSASSPVSAGERLPSGGAPPAKESPAPISGDQDPKPERSSQKVRPKRQR